MATQQKYDGQCWNVGSVAASWSLMASWPDYDGGGGVRICSIEYHPPKQSTLVIRNIDANGPVIFKAECADSTDVKIKYFEGAKKKPFINLDECVAASVASSLIIIEQWDRN